MPLVMIGLSHQSAPVEVRERLAFTVAGALGEALGQIKAGLPPGGECVLLSTCNRTELYVATSAREPDGDAALLLAGARGLAVGEFTPYLHELRGHRAVEHLFRVAAGLDSMILGEPDIVRQVKAAYTEASDVGATGPTLNPLFHRALFVAKRARTETALGRGAFSVGHAAAEMAQSIFGSLSGRSVLLLGAGKMSEATARHLAASGARSVLVANRTFDRAARLAEALNGRAVHYDEFPAQLERADIVIASTAAPHTVVHRPMVESVLHARRHRPLFLIDIAVPRDIDADVGDLPDVFLYNIDDLRAVVDADQAERRQEALRAEALVREEAVAFWGRLRSQETATPLVTSVRAKMDTIRDSEMARLRQRLAHLPPEDWEAIERFSASLVNKIAHAPTRKIKDFAADERSDEKMETVRELFELDGAAARAGEEPPP